MRVVRITLTDEDYMELAKKAEAERVTMHDYIRERIFDKHPAFTPEASVRKALEKYKPGDKFTLPMLYGDEWKVGKSEAGVLGRQFDKYVKKYYADWIEKVENERIDRCTAYRILEKYTPAEAAELALEKFKPGDVFTLPMVYGDDWDSKTVSAGLFGISFDLYIQENCSGKIEKTDKKLDDRAAYRVI